MNPRIGHLQIVNAMTLLDIEVDHSVMSPDLTNRIFDSIQGLACGDNGENKDSSS